MKTQTWQIEVILKKVTFFSSENKKLALTTGAWLLTASRMWEPDKDYNWKAFKEKRENGEDKDNPKDLSLGRDGKFTWLKGEVKEDCVYGVERPDNTYEYQVQYDAGLKDLVYFEAKDRNYLTRILQEGNLREKEPAVWYLYEVDNPQKLNIADWWSHKLKLPTIALDELLKTAEILEKEYGKKLEHVNMKIQSFTVISPRVRQSLPGSHYLTVDFLYNLAKRDCKKKRENGTEVDNPKNLSLETNGTSVCSKGTVQGNFIYGVLAQDGYYDYEVYYNAGSKDLAYFEAKDRNYLTRILKDGTLRKEEPAIWFWYLYESSGAKKLNIADWWSQKLKLPFNELDKLLKDAALAEKQHGHEFMEERLRKEREEKLAIEQQEQGKIAREQQAVEVKAKPEQEQREAKMQREKRQEEEAHLTRQKTRQEEIVKLEAELKEKEEEDRLESLRQKLKTKEKQKLSVEKNPELSTGAETVITDKKIDNENWTKHFKIEYPSIELGKELGKGGFGVVCQAKYQLADVAVKTLIIDKMTAKAEQEFKNEVALMAESKHPNIVNLYGFCLNPYAIVMELMPHGTLFHLLQSDYKLKWPDKFSIAMDVAAGLMHLHNKNIIHRDLKSLNILLGDNYRAKLTDFGLAQIKNLTASTTKAESSVGTLAWMAPEIFGMKPKYGKASDIYAYAMVLWELVTCKIPYDGALPVSIQSGVQQGQREDIPDEFQKDHPAFAEIIKKCWEQRSEKRPTIEAIANLLQESKAKDIKEIQDEKPATNLSSFRGNLNSGSN